MPSRTVRHPRSVGLTTVGVSGLVAITALAGCGSSSSGAKPAATGSASSANARTVSVEITNDDCKPGTSNYTSGPLTFAVKNTNATGVTEIELLSGERIVGEKENLAPGFSGSFSLNLSAGEYTLYCPGASTDKSTIKVTGGAVSTAPTDTSALLAQGTKDYAQYVNTQVALMITNTQPLIDAIKANNLSAAQAAYAKARPYYERIEPVAESFTSGKDNLDADIDSRADDVPIAKLTGYHRIEYGLFQVKSTAGLDTYATGLLGYLEKLQGLTKDLTYQPAELANGAVGLLDEAAKSKITGEEERYSHIDLLDFEANDEGAEQAFADLEPGLTKIDSGLARTITTQFAALDKLVDTYRTSSNPSGFVYYSVLNNADKRKLAAAVKAVQEPLSQVASKVAKG
jgi:iron uptake system component EfeO